MTLDKTLKLEGLKIKNKVRSNFYLSPSFFVTNKDFILCTETFNVYAGYFNIPKGSTFYTEICVNNLVDITNKEEVLAFLTSKKGIRVCFEQFNKQFIRPAKKFLKRYKVFDSELLIDLVKLKMKSKDSFMRFINSTKEKKYISKTSILIFT